VIESTSKSPATDINIGIGYPVPEVEMHVRSSPNVLAEIALGYPKGSNQSDNALLPTFIVVKLPSLPPGETAIVMLGWRLTAADEKKYFGLRPAAIEHLSSATSPGETARDFVHPEVFYMNSREVRGRIEAVQPFAAISTLHAPQLAPKVPFGRFPAGEHSFQRFEQTKEGLVYRKTGHTFVTKKKA
jgi:hypothetical protein